MRLHYGSCSKPGCLYSSQALLNCFEKCILRYIYIYIHNWLLKREQNIHTCPELCKLVCVKDNFSLIKISFFTGTAALSPLDDPPPPYNGLDRWQAVNSSTPVPSIEMHSYRANLITLVKKNQTKVGKYRLINTYFCLNTKCFTIFL